PKPLRITQEQPEFWPIWLQHKTYLFQRCLHWMGGNRTYAEEALSCAMLKARGRWPQYADEITNPKAWLTRLTHNLCVDLHRAHRREVIVVDNFEEVIANSATSTNIPSPNTALLKQELKTYLHHIISELPPRLQQPFILRFLQEKPYKDIAQQLLISEDNARKRAQQACSILRKQLKQYLAGLSKAEIATTASSAQQLWEKSLPKLHQSASIDYGVSATCLETLPHVWYQSPMPMAWT
ncbi:sigma-70 family RNA polymerase sigma factor, partial [Oscillatoria sp. CS-180]|uniref:RNA polymerase sigma factor n=1 Tax=Oscillatoria sp. CS-180 TaxID=3021720 RepID=UPI00232CF1BB